MNIIVVFDGARNPFKAGTNHARDAGVEAAREKIVWRWFYGSLLTNEYACGMGT